MRTETTTRTLYKFDELTDAAKEEARNWYRESGLDYEWWEYTYDDAERIGLKITAFDLDRRGVDGNFIASAEETAHRIEKEHGEKCETFTDAKAYLEARDKVIEQWERDENGDFVNQDRLDISLDALDSNFLHTLCEDYRIMLKHEAEYMESNESIDENIRCNEYEFTEEGHIS